MEKRKGLAIVHISGDESRWVAQWAKSVLSVNPDVVIINLTQYNDDSEELYKKYIPKDKLVFMKKPWQGSFSEARNHTLSAVSEWEEEKNKQIDFCFFVDSDEKIIEESLPHIENILHRGGDHVQIHTQIYNSVGQAGMAASLYYPRIFPHRDKNGKKLNPYFESAVHNQLLYPKNTLVISERSLISVFHYGYALDATAMKKKHERSEKLLRDQIEKDNDNYFAHLNLAQLLRAKNDIPGAIIAAENVLRIIENEIDSKNPHLIHAYLMANEQLATCFIVTKEYDKSIEHSQNALNKKPDYLDALMNLAHANMEKRDFDKAEFWLKRFLFIRTKYNEISDNTNLILNHLNSSFIALYHLGSINYMKKKAPKALEYYEKSFAEEPSYADVFIRLIDCLKVLGRENEISEKVNAFMHSHPDKAYQVYHYFGDVELEACNFENAKFNYYQAVNLSENESEHPRIKVKWDSITSVFGQVSEKYFDTSNKNKELKNRIS